MISQAQWRTPGGQLVAMTCRDMGWCEDAHLVIDGELVNIVGFQRFRDGGSTEYTFEYKDAKHVLRFHRRIGDEQYESLDRERLTDINPLTGLIT